MYRFWNWWLLFSWWQPFSLLEIMIFETQKYWAFCTSMLVIYLYFSFEERLHFFPVIKWVFWILSVYILCVSYILIVMPFVSLLIMTHINQFCARWLAGRGFLPFWLLSSLLLLCFLQRAVFLIPYIPTSWLLPLSPELPESYLETHYLRL